MTILVKKKIARWLDIAKEAALRAGKFFLHADGSSKKVKMDSNRDIKIQGDVQSEKIVLDYLRKYSDFSILSEESGLVKRDRSSFLWIVDPLDGSLNYMRGMPFCCISVGLWQGQKPLLGVVYDFNRDELYSGIAGQAAWLNMKELKVTDNDEKMKAVLCTGFPVSTDFSKRNIFSFIKKAQSYKKIRLLGSAALSLAYVASGKVDIYYEKNIKLWDVAGSLPLVLGAGGKIKMKKGTGRYLYDVCAWNGRLKGVLS